MSYNYNPNGVGSNFKTGNSTVAGLKVGTKLEVVGAGQLRITEVPKRVFKPGDRFLSKYGWATVVDSSSRLDLSDSGFDSETEVLYMADGSYRVRRAIAADIQ